MGKNSGRFCICKSENMWILFFLLESRWIRLLCVPLYFFILTLNSYYLNGTDPLESFFETDSDAGAGIRLVCDYVV